MAAIRHLHVHLLRAAAIQRLQDHHLPAAATQHLHVLHRRHHLHLRRAAAEGHLHPAADADNQ